MAPAGGSQGQGGNQGTHEASGVGGGVHHGAAQEGSRSAAFPTHNSGGVLKAVQPHTSTPVLTTGSLPATIPTYDDSSPVKTPAPVGSRAQVEKEEEVRTGTGRILDMVEKQEQYKEEAEEDEEKD